MCFKQILNQQAELFRQGLARYLSEQDLIKLRSVKVGIIGAGGLGSNCAMLLVRSGFEELVIADFDRVEASNLNRQVYLAADIGHEKVYALADKLHAINPAVNLTLISQKISEENIHNFFASCQVLVEAVDIASVKAMIYRQLYAKNVFLVLASGLAGCGGKAMQVKQLNVKTVMVGDFLTEVTADNPPLAPRVMQAAALQADAVLSYVLNNLS